MTKALSITMFASFELIAAPSRRLAFKSGKPGLLLAYLVCSPRKSHERKALAEWLWPDHPPEVATVNLRTLLARMRREFTAAEISFDAVFAVERHQLAFCAAEIETDVGSYEAAQEAARKATDPADRCRWLTTATAHYRGEFLPGFHDDWANEQRRFFADRQHALLHQLAALCEEAGDLEAAIFAAEQAWHADRHDELSAELLMRLLFQSGKYGEVVRVFRRLSDGLRHDLSVSPSNEAKSLAQRARRQSRVTGLSAPISDARPEPVLPAFRLPSSPLLRPLTRFFGREDELERIARLLAFGERTLLTLTGLGGSGKTRLALEAAHRLKAEWNERVSFVELAPLTHAENFLETIATVLLPGVPISANPIAHLARAIGDRPTLLVLDNLEHLLEAARPQILALMQSVPALSLLVTSRERLQIQGEIVLPVLPLPTSSATPKTTDPQDRAAGIRLFLDRARTANPDFSPTPDDLRRVTEICRLLEGIPLALELAAAWLDTLTLPQLQHRLKRRFEMLVSPHKDVAPRHRTLRKTLDWSVERLTPELKTVFFRLAVFRGGWTLDAANVVCEISDVLPQLRLLGDKSLLNSSAHGEEIRYSMLETLREYALETVTPAEKSRAETLHADYFFSLAFDAEASLIGRDALHWLDRLEADHENVLLALDLLFAQNRSLSAMNMTVSLSLYWARRNHLRSGREQLERLFPRCPEPTVLRAKALWVLGYLIQMQGDLEQSKKLFEESRHLAERLGEKVLASRAILALGHTALSRSEYENARDLLEEGIERSERHGDDFGLARGLHSLGSLDLAQGRYEEAQTAYEHSLRLWRIIGDAVNEAQTLLNLAALLSELDPASAVPLFRQAHAIFVETNNLLMSGVTSQALGAIAIRQRNQTEAERQLADSLSLTRQTGWKLMEAITLIHLGNLRLNQNHFSEAEALYRQGLTGLAQGQERLRIAQGLHAFARLCWRRNLPARAVWLFSATDALTRSISGVLANGLKPDHEEALAAVRDALSATDFKAHWNAGQSANWETAVAYALETFES